MNTTKKITIDWNSPDVLEQIIEKIKNPLDNILTASKKYVINNNDKKDGIIFSNSKEISDIIEEILSKTKSRSLNLTFRNCPDIFDIYESNEKVRELCSKEINPKKITKMDQDWLINLEKEVYGAITQNELNLYELSYKMAVSERQLHRKIANLVYLIPNNQEI